MHELSIATSLLEAVLAELARIEPRPGRLVKVRVVVGQLHQIVPDCLTFAYEAVARGTPAEGSRLELAALPVEVRCGRCGWEGPIKMPFFQCGSCGGTDVQMRKGKELYLDSLEVEPADSPPPARP